MSGTDALENPPRNGEGDHAKRGGGAGSTLTGPRATVNNARRLRREMTLPEVIVWQAIRGQQLGVKFRKQHPAGDYVLDFYCASARLAIEVDGEAHSSPEKIAKDQRRDQWLARWNVRVLRIPAREILSHLPNVIEAIMAAVAPDQPLHQPAAGPPPRSGEDFQDAHS